jgi:hypothetical protein
MGVGLSGLGVAVALVFYFVERHQSKTPEKVAQEESETQEYV